MKLHVRKDTNDDAKLRLSVYTDADYAADKPSSNRLSPFPPLEAEFVAAAVGTRELLRLRQLMEELEISVRLPMVIRIDKQTAIKQAENEATSSAFKHVDVKRKFVKNVASSGVIKPAFVGSKDNIADLLIKSFPAPRLLELCTAIVLRQ
ncbi:TPA: hypothetical protein N0F65_006188 [Lagenidium giganteum]|uniref:Uncharacterized protein n=1 Tax=Lagenidium giganteum TaxID=4803 RepID=A0AAV2ZAP2_9STRA|nr:TPA: hypothetical protein N0F65_006188 [Lagenidium giganteum]